MKYIKYLLILIILLSPVLSHGAKVQVDDTWIYTTETESFPETALEIIQHNSGGDPLALAVIDTDRKYEYPLKTSLWDLTVHDDGVLWVTQEGGIPLAGNHTVSGWIKAGGVTYNVNQQPEFILYGSPADAIATAETSTYSRAMQFNDVDGKDVWIQEHFIIYTNNEQSDTVRDYKIERTQLSVHSTNPLITNIVLSQSNELVAEITWDANYKAPTYIKEYDTAVINPLSLSQNNFIEYFLDIDKNADNDRFLSLELISVLIALPLIKKLQYKPNLNTE